MDTPHPSPRTNRTRRVPHPVLIGHAASLSQVANATAAAAEERDFAAAQDALAKLAALARSASLLQAAQSAAAGLDRASAARRALHAAKEGPWALGLAGAARRLRAASAAYRMRARRMLLRTVGAGASAVSERSAGAVLSSLRSLTATPSEVDPDSVEVAARMVPLHPPYSKMLRLSCKNSFERWTCPPPLLPRPLR
jgi:hypothetical protein